MRSIEKSAKTVEEAIKTALLELGVDSSDVTIDILEYGSPGLFGMFGKNAKVRLTVKEDPELDFEMPVFSLDQSKTKKHKEPEAQHKKTDAAPAADETPVAEENAAGPEKTETEKESYTPKKKGDSQSTKRRRQSNQSAKHDDNKSVDTEKVEEDIPVIAYEDLSESAKVAYDFLTELTKLMNVQVELRVSEESERIFVQMLGDTMGVLIGRRGETLDALQYLTSLQVNKGRDEYIRVTLDTEHYRARREEALKKLAARMAGRVKKTGHRVALEPMNPYERRVLHSALQTNPYVTTHSEGEEPYRRVIITPK